MSASALNTVDPLRPPHMRDSAAARIEAFDDDALWPPILRIFAEWFRDRASGPVIAGAPPIEDLAQYVGLIHKIVVEEDGADFRYRIYARAVSRAANMDMQGRLVSELAEPARSAFLSHYRELYQRPHLFVGTLRYDGGVERHPVWLRAAAPFGGARVEGFLVMTYPEDAPPTVRGDLPATAAGASPRPPPPRA